jgi:LGFP repeat
LGRFNRFSNNGAIYWSGTTGAWEVYGPVLEAGKKDVVNVAGVSRNGATATITSAANGAQKHATVSLSGGSRTGASTFTLSKLALTPGKALKLSLAAYGSSVDLHSPCWTGQAGRF